MGQIKHQVNLDGSILSIHQVVVHKISIADVEDPDL